MKKIILCMFMLLYNIVSIASDDSIELMPIYISKKNIKQLPPLITEKDLNKKWHFFTINNKKEDKKNTIKQFYHDTVYEISKLFKERSKTWRSYVKYDLLKRSFPDIVLCFEFSKNSHSIRSRRGMFYVMAAYLNVFNTYSDEELKEMYKKLKNIINPFWDGINNEITTIIETYNLNPDDYRLY